MKLPIGVYVVCQAFAEATEPVTFAFREEKYEALPGVNAFASLDDLSDIPLQAPEAPFCGYGDTPVVLIPAGIYKAGPGKVHRFRTYMPCAMTILGENVGIDPNGPDLRTAAPRREESVIKGSFYFGCIAMCDTVEGCLTLDGLTFDTSKLADERSETENAGFVVKNCRFTGGLSYDLIRVVSCQYPRYTRVENCRLDGFDSYCGEGRLLGIEGGDLVAEGLYFAHTNKFPGMTNYSRTIVDHLDKLTMRRCLFEACGSVHGFVIQLPEDCEFSDFAPTEDAALLVRLPETASLTVRSCRFHGQHTAPAVLIDGCPGCVHISDSIQEGYTALWSPLPTRRETVDHSPKALDDPHQPLPYDPEQLAALYENTHPYYCDFHCHSNSGGTSDGKTPIEEYVSGMDALGVDCAAIVDHRQMRHYFLPAWDEERLICGSEPGMRMIGREGSMDYTMIFPDKTGLAQVMGAFPEFKFTGTWDGHFNYPQFDRQRFQELGEYIYSIGGLLSHAHPLQLPGTDDTADYFFGEQVAFETVHADVNAFATRNNHAMWLRLLAEGKRVRTHGSSDSHGPVSNRGLTTVYTEKRFSTDVFNAVRSGNCAAGGVGIQMAIGDTVMGSVATYGEGLRLSIRVADFHRAHWHPNTVYALKIYTDKGLAYVAEFDGTQPVTVTLPVEHRLFYRCEVVNESDHLPVAFSNPIWLDEAPSDPAVTP